MNGLTPDDRPDKIDDFLRLYLLVKHTPGLPMPHGSAARASFDYRHVVHEADARESVADAVAVLTYVFGVAFGAGTETAGDGTPRYVMEALLPSGLALVVISRFAQTADQDELVKALAA